MGKNINFIGVNSIKFNRQFQDDSACAIFDLNLTGLQCKHVNGLSPALCILTHQRDAGGSQNTCGSWDEIEELEPSVKDKLIFLANAIIRDAKTGKAYAH